MTFLEKILPASANNDYRGSPIALYTFIVLCTLYTGRSLIHFLKEDSGVNSIASFMYSGKLPLLIVACLMLFLSLRPGAPPRSAGDDGSS